MEEYVTIHVSDFEHQKTIITFYSIIDWKLIGNQHEILQVTDMTGVTYVYMKPGWGFNLIKNHY